MNTTEAAKRIEMTYLRKSGYLCGWTSRTLSWNWRGEPSGSITAKIDIGLYGTEPHMELDYRTRVEGEDWRPVKYRVRLEATPCRFGGRRWWFICPNLGCGRRNLVLYQHWDRFVCRKCAGLRYNSQSYRSKGFGPFGRVLDAEAFELTMKRWYYRGKPTRKHRKLLRLRGGMDPLEALCTAASSMGISLHSD